LINPNHLHHKILNYNQDLSGIKGISHSLSFSLWTSHFLQNPPLVWPSLFKNTCKDKEKENRNQNETSSSSCSPPYFPTHNSTTSILVQTNKQNQFWIPHKIWNQESSILPNLFPSWPKNLFLQLLFLFQNFRHQ
jgi:hypothetical protein